MFTGLIEAQGKLLSRDACDGDHRLRLATGSLDMSDVAIGDSICVSGVCLTAVALSPDAFDADVSGETLQCTTLGTLPLGAAINLEKSLLPTTRLGGHIVSGHVDGIGSVTSFDQVGRSWRLEVSVPPELGKYIAQKGSICIDGISLTVNGVTNATFHVNIVPHTLQVTTIGEFAPDRLVNLEVDVIARYLERLALGNVDGGAQAPTLSERTLRDNGFI